MAGQHVPEGVWSVVGQACRFKCSVHDFAVGFGTFPRAASDAIGSKTDVGLRRHGGGREEWVVGAIESKPVKVGELLAQHRHRVIEALSKECVDALAKLGGKFAGIMGHGFFFAVDVFDPQRDECRDPDALETQ